jgi:RNA polymerase sigma-70 factor (sigma-E family)
VGRDRDDDDGGRAGPAAGQAFDEFVTRRYPGLLRTAYLLTGDRGLAEDLVQTALFSTFKRWHTLRDQTDPGAYVRKVMVTTQTSWMRRKASGEHVVDVPPDRPGDEGTSTAERLVLWQALGQLPARMRAVVVLRFYEDLTEAETATVLGCSVGTVKSQTSRGLDRLRDLFAADDDDPAPRGGPRLMLWQKETS